MMLILAAIPVGLLHTLMGPDHYIPFIAMAKARSWSMKKTAAITTLCGIGHVLSAAILGAVGLALGITFTKFTFIETWRGEIAAWLLISFGLLYFVWGVRAAIKNKKHTHKHIHFLQRCFGNKECYEHEHAHGHGGEHFHAHLAPHEHGAHEQSACACAHTHDAHPHAHGADANANSITAAAPSAATVAPASTAARRKELTPWILFIVFILGPCEPLIPLMMYPAIKGVTLYVLLVSLAFGIATLAAMLGAVFASLYGLRLVKVRFLERYGAALSGAIICSLGLGIKFGGL